MMKRLLCLITCILFGMSLNTQAQDKIYLGIDVLQHQGFKQIKGKNIGLLTNLAGVNREGISTISILRNAPGVRLKALFGPEHGIYGDEIAYKPVEDKIDRKTGLPIYSLYGEFRHPTEKMLQGLDTIVIDIQDLGVRSYTYIASVRYVVEECFKHNIEVIVLDRPNPLSGLKVSGPIIEEKWISYVGAYPIPYVYGLTIGELVYMSKETKGMLDLDDKTRKNGKLTIIPMHGWKRSMRWDETGLKWIPTSPIIKDLSAALGYSMTGLGCIGSNFKHGYGTKYPFRMLQYAGKTPEQIMVELRNRHIPGLDYRIVTFKNKKGQIRRGVYLLVKDWKNFDPTEISFNMMQIAAKWDQLEHKGNPFASGKRLTYLLFNKHIGDEGFWNDLVKKGYKIDLKTYIQQWKKDANRFQERSKQFWIYNN